MFFVSFPLFFTIFQLVCQFQAVIGPPPPFEDKCYADTKSLYPPPNSTVPWFTLNLDSPGVLRWKEIGQRYKAQVQELVATAKSTIRTFFGKRIVQMIEDDVEKLINKFPEPYADEIKGISQAAAVSLSDIIFYNVFYEVFTVCTSIVAQDPNDKLYHVRNMDFGLLMGWNLETHDWALTEKLRQTVINVNWVKENRTLFKSVNFAGYIGVFNAVKQNSFAVTINERFSFNGGYLGILEWLLGRSNATWFSFLVRRTMETKSSYTDAVEDFKTVQVIAPLYIIVSGTKSGEGQIIVRSRTKTDGTVSLDPSRTTNGWYILQTNYDPWRKPLFFDDRRTPGNKCMQKLTRKNVDFAGLFNVLSSPTTLNKLTVYSVLMQTDEGTLETYVQKCPDPCWPW